ncbi:hypothetical protein TSOC_006548 [Tetrabaena socialis]|uniref:Plastid lipid-associated protein/fibrillin conserved domain-containing protein n=1 Tax=Tetrabaena socialis TaxID=47790 RepID=A0A2J7ZQR4_9CHLO|nr:hypothetical protein TSOC_011398 [Tetrabaena socialis]PNH07046.1 hypothetical protein TSOC_006548 [Tetrabaena socialis]|eukprot:PNH02612.1 hypothetical protein TSOC_011398 [Tetrabaena socialis]
MQRARHAPSHALARPRPHPPGPLRARVALCALPRTAPDVAAVKRELLDLVSRTDRGVSTSSSDLRGILEAVGQLRRAGENTDTTGPSTCGTWELAWTTEKVRGRPGPGEARGAADAGPPRLGTSRPITVQATGAAGAP